MAAGSIVLLASYISSYGISRYLMGRSFVNSTYRVPLERLAPVVYEPLYVYRWSGMPGSSTLRAFGAWCFYQGNGQHVEWSALCQKADSAQVLPD